MGQFPVRVRKYENDVFDREAGSSIYVMLTSCATQTVCLVVCITMAQGSTQPVTEINTKNISWGGKGGRCVGLTTLLPSCADCLEIWEPQPPATLRASRGL